MAGAYHSDTIAAQATPPGRGGVGIVRVSGPQAGAIAAAVLGRLPPPRYAEYRSFRDASGAVIDAGVALYFPGPNSFTGEDVLELHGHGGPVVMDMLLRAVVSAGARLARPGEFSQRAFLNDKLDLAQAEAIADLIDSATEAAARSALRSLSGEFSRRIETLVAGLIDLRVYVEAAIDFPDEDIDFLANDHVVQRLATLLAEVEAVSGTARQGHLLNEGMTLVILGRPNAGKSSLLNLLSGRDAAIVTDVPGTTRDVLRERVHIDGMPLHVVDTAGLRESGDTIEREGMRRAWDEVAHADRILLVIDDRQGVTNEDAAILARLPAGRPITLIRNKIDLSGAAAAIGETGGYVSVAMSARSAAGFDLLRAHLKDAMGYRAEEGLFTARRRHLDALERARAALQRGTDQLRRFQAGELLAEDLREAQRALGEITGEFDNEALLDRIFSSFCIGK